jgi:TolB protein
MTSFLFAFDAQMEIIKRKLNLPNVVVSISSESISNKISVKIKELIKKDLLVSGHFQVIDKNISIYFDSTPAYEQMKQDDIDLFLTLHVEDVSIGGLVAKIKLYDVNKNDIVLNKIYSVSSYDKYPFLSHQIAITVNQYLNAPSIQWMDKFVIFARYNNAKDSEIVISDYTLTYQKVVVSGGLNIFPKWTNKQQESFYYTSYNGEIPILKKQNLYTLQSENILSSDGMIVCSDVAEEDSKIVVTMAPNAQPDIYIYDLKDKIKTRLTKYKGIDVGGSFVEDNKKIVFISDRLKQPNIFAKTIGQKGVERLVYHGKNNSQCTTFNNYIVYSSRESDNEFGKNSFNLYLISTQSDFIRRLTSTGRNQFPKFSQDGDSVLFIKAHQGKSYLGIIRLNYDKSFLFPLKSGRLQSIDW